MTDPLLLKPQEVADLLGVGRSSIYRLMTNGQIAYVRIGSDRRIPATELDRFITDNLQIAGRGASSRKR